MTETKRQVALRAVCERYGLEIVDHDHPVDSGQEDIAEYFFPGRVSDESVPEGKTKPILRYAVVTEAGEFVYINAEHDDLREAERAAVENIGDPIYSEAPIVIIDLDTGAEHRPLWRTVAWETS